MLGAIIGDTIGSVYELQNTKDYNFTLFMGNSTYTDDSVMTMAVAYWLLQDKEYSYQGLEDIMVMFGEKFPFPMGGYGGGFHNWLFFPEGLYDFEGTTITLHEVKIGDAVLRNVDASVVKNQQAPLLLGQSVMERFGTITIDNQNNKLIIKH